MSPGRKKYDGALFGGSDGITKRRDTFGFESEAYKSSSAKRPAKNHRLLEHEGAAPEEEGEKDRYLITYADLITLLLGLFIILYTISNIDSKKYQVMLSALGSTFGANREIINISPQNLNNDLTPSIQLKDKIQDIITEHDYGNFIKLEENERGITIHILDQILFASGSAKLEDRSFEVLQKIGGVIKDIPNDIRIEGHTDNVPIHTSEFPSNWHLSVARALNTAYFFIDSQHLPQDKLSVVGYSEFKPIASNDDADGKTKNRRVDIVIIK